MTEFRTSLLYSKFDDNFPFIYETLRLAANSQGAQKFLHSKGFKIWALFSENFPALLGNRQK